MISPSLKGIKRTGKLVRICIVASEIIFCLSSKVMIAKRIILKICDNKYSPLMIPIIFSGVVEKVLIISWRI